MNCIQEQSNGNVPEKCSGTVFCTVVVWELPYKNRAGAGTALRRTFTRSTAHSMRAFCKEGQKIVDVAKGVEEKTLMTLSQIIEEEVPQAA